MSKPSVAEALFLVKLSETNLPTPESEVRPWSDRQFRVDFLWPTYSLAVEIEGGSYVQGRHHRPKGFESDCEKYNRLAADNICLFRFTPAMIRSGLAISTVEEYFYRWHDLESAEEKGTKCEQWT